MVEAVEPGPPLTIHVFHHVKEAGRRGGVRRFVDNLYPVLERLGARVLIYAAGRPRTPGLPVMGTVPRPAPYLRALFRKAPRIPFDGASVIHVHRMEYVLPFMGRRSVPLVWFIHGEYLSYLDVAPRWARPLVRGTYGVLVRMAARRADAVLAVSRRALDSYGRACPWIAGKASVVPVGIDPEDFAPRQGSRQRVREGFGIAEEATVFLALAVNNPLKRLPYMIEAFGELQSRTGRPSHLLLGGPDASDPRLLPLISRLGLQSSVRLLGHVEKKDLRDVFAAADVLLHTSASEASPTIFREAAAAGIPFVTSDVGDARELIAAGAAGGVLPVDATPAQFAEGLARFLASPANRPSSLPPQYDVRETARQILGISEEAWRAKAAARPGRPPA